MDCINPGFNDIDEGAETLIKDLQVECLAWTHSRQHSTEIHNHKEIDKGIQGQRPSQTVLDLLFTHSWMASNQQGLLI